MLLARNVFLKVSSTLLSWVTINQLIKSNDFKDKYYKLNYSYQGMYIQNNKMTAKHCH